MIIASLLVLFLILILLGISAFLSASETAIIGINKIKLRHLVNQGVKNAKTLQDIVEHIDDFLITILVGNNFVNTTISAIGTAIFIYFFGNHPWVVFIATVIVAMVLLLFGEITPKVLAANYTERMALSIARIIKLIVSTARPLTGLFPIWSNLNIKLLGGKPARRIPLLTEEEIKMMIEIGKQEGVVMEEEKRLLHRIFKFADLEAKDVMVPGKEMHCIKINASLQELIDQWGATGHSKIPAYEDTLDNIRGIVAVRNIPRMLKDNHLLVTEDILQPAYFVPPQKKVIHLLLDFQKMKNYTAIVQQDNKTLGMVTLEDLIEEIIGEI